MARQSNSNPLDKTEREPVYLGRGLPLSDAPEGEGPAAVAKEAPSEIADRGIVELGLRCVTSPAVPSWPSDAGVSPQGPPRMGSLRLPGCCRTWSAIPMKTTLAAAQRCRSASHGSPEPDTRSSAFRTSGPEQGRSGPRSRRSALPASEDSACEDVPRTGRGSLSRRREEQGTACQGVRHRIPRRCTDPSRAPVSPRQRESRRAAPTPSSE